MGGGGDWGWFWKLVRDVKEGVRKVITIILCLEGQFGKKGSLL